jgi:hypothetical protein
LATISLLIFSTLPTQLIHGLRNLFFHVLPPFVCWWCVGGWQERRSPVRRHPASRPPAPLLGALDESDLDKFVPAALDGFAVIGHAVLDEVAARDDQVAVALALLQAVLDNEPEQDAQGVSG